MLLKDFYSIDSEKSDNERYFTRIKINKNHEIYNGHFPGRPVTPGVILMQLFKEDVERRCGFPLKLQKAENIKFMAVVDPHKDPYLILDYSLEKEKEVIILKGIAKTEAGISLKINSFFKKLSGSKARTN